MARCACDREPPPRNVVNQSSTIQTDGDDLVITIKAAMLRFLTLGIFSYTVSQGRLLGHLGALSASLTSSNLNWSPS